MLPSGQACWTVAKVIALSAYGMSSFPGPIKSHNSAANAAMFVRSCAAQALNHGNGNTLRRNKASVMKI